jgi:hypothetical protein
LTLTRVIVIEDVRSSSTPLGGSATSWFNANARVGLDVAHPVRIPAALREQPKRLALQPIADGRKPRLSGAPPGRLQQGIAGIWDSEAERNPDQRVDD